MGHTTVPHAAVLACMQLLRGLLYCTDSKLDQAITCLESTSEYSCAANTACVWSNRAFHHAYYNVSKRNKTTEMMTAIYEAITKSMGRLSVPVPPYSYDSIDAYLFESSSSVALNDGTTPFSYCAARCVNQ